MTAGGTQRARRDGVSGEHLGVGQHFESYFRENQRAHNHPEKIHRRAGNTEEQRRDQPHRRSLSDSPDDLWFNLLLSFLHNGGVTAISNLRIRVPFGI